jgi:two-component system sensor histidine kinase KdpD
MGGTLAADDTPGGGLTMTVSLPAAGQPGDRTALDEEREATPHEIGTP